MYISSPDNKTLKNITKLKDKKYRDLSRLYIAEGKIWVKECLIKHAMSDIVHQILVSESFEKDLSDDLRELIGNSGAEYIVLKDSLFTKLSDLSASPGIAAVLKMPALRNLSLTDSAEFMSERCVYLDRIRDPGNLGTIIRTSLAFGYRDIILNNCADIYSPKVTRSTLSAILDVSFIDDSDKSALKAIKSRGFKVIAGDLNGKTLERDDDFGVNYEKICIVIGSESDGISKNILSYADICVKIPISDIESLNAAVAAAILMYTYRK